MVTSCRSDNARSNAASRAISGDLVMMPIERSRKRSSTSSRRRVMPESALGRLVGIGRRADDQRLPVQTRGIEGARQHLRRVRLDQDATLEREPGRHGGSGVVGHDARRARGPLYGVAVGIAGVAVGAAELAPDVGIDRPEPHPGAGRAVEHRAGTQLEKRGAAGPPVEHVELPRRRRQDRQLELPGAHPHFPQPQVGQVTQAEARASGPAHSGQSCAGLVVGR